MQEKTPLIRYYLKGNDISMLCEALYDEEHPWRIYKYEPAQGWLYIGKKKEFDKESEIDEETVASVCSMAGNDYLLRLADLIKVKDTQSALLLIDELCPQVF